MRVRVGMAVAVVYIVNSSLTAPPMLMDGRWGMAGVSLVSIGLGAVSIYLLRRRRSPVLPASMLLAWFLLALVMLGSVQGGYEVSSSVWAGILALLALYMLGPRLGSIFAVLTIGQVFSSFALHHSGASLPGGHLPPGDSWMAAASAVIGIAMITTIGYLYEVAQKRTLGELQDALITSEHNERQLDALVESTTSAMCSLDRDLRLLTCNHAFAELRSGSVPPVRGEALADILPPARYESWQGRIERVLAGAGPVTFEESPPAGQDAPHCETTMHPIAAGDRVAGVTVFSRDITERKHAEAELRRLNQELVRISRSAGMAAVASEVLHNAGNVLNSTGVSVAMLERDIKNLKTGHMFRVVELLEQNRATLEVFLREDPRGQRVLELLRGLAEHFGQQQRQLAEEIASLRDNTEHLTRVIQAQQSHTRALGIIETVPVDELIEAALELQAPSWEQLGIAVERRSDDLPPLQIDRHKVIEILLNLVSNARHALRDSDRPDKRLSLRAEAAGPERVCIHVQDNGPGIAPEHRDRLFRLGFTTKRDGNGIGLHASAIAAQQLGGSLSFHSDGPGHGATFTLELPRARAALPMLRADTPVQ